MPQIDVILRFASLAAAKADASVRQHYDAIEDLFAGDRVIPNIKVWRASQDVAGTDGEGNPTVTHTYLTGWFVLVSLPRLVPALRDHAAVQVVINGETNEIIRKTVTNAVMQDLRFEPVFAGRDYPWGNWPL